MTNPAAEPADGSLPTPAAPAAPASEPIPAPQSKSSAIAEILPTEQFSQYLLYGKGEMLPVLRGLVEQVSQVTMMFNEGRDMVLTSLASCDEDGIVMDFGASQEMNRLAQKAEKLFCITQLGKVKIQFILRGVTEVEAGGRPAFFAALPDSILRLQRREHYRLALSITQPLKCRIRLVNAEGSSVLIDANVVDISGGGVGLAGLPLDLALEPDVKISGCVIESPELGSITTSLLLHRVIETTSRRGVRAKRAGCEFVDLTGSMEKLIQRFIMKVERERKARESGLA